MAAEEFDFPLDDIVERDAAFVDVIVPALAAPDLDRSESMAHHDRGNGPCPWGW